MDPRQVDRFQLLRLVEAGKSREERASRLADVPAAWRDQVEAHVRCAFQVRAEARRKGKP